MWVGRIILVLAQLPFLAATVVAATSVSPPRAYEEAARTSVLPPIQPWDGASRSLVVAADDPWITPSERTNLTQTPRYDETVAWLRRLVDAAPELHMVSLGQSHEGRDVWMVIASREGAQTAAQLALTGRPTLLAQAGIHAGEIDGKDAGLMLLRDMTVGQRETSLLDQTNFLFVPIFNVDGHERFSAYGRVNQRGPAELGWRTNRRNLNLNRDYSKLDTPEMQAMVRAIREYEPDLYLDLHVTDGVDYQYDITYGYHGDHAWSPNISRWLDEHYRPTVDRALTDQGHVPGPLIFGVNGRDISAGIYDWTGSPRFSNSYGDARHLPTVLLENHSLKPYDQRVLGTYVFLRASMRSLAKYHADLTKATSADQSRRPRELALSWQTAPDLVPETIAFRGIESRTELSPVSGAPVVRWTGRPVTIQAPVVTSDHATTRANRPSGYVVPASWPLVAERMAIHGIVMEQVTEARAFDVEVIRLPEASLDDAPFEGHARVTPGALAVTREDRTYPAGSWFISCDQPLGDLAMLLLEPESPDSFLQWGFFLEILQRTEYFEAYALEPMAQAMLDSDPKLAVEFQQKLLNDSAFAGNARARLEWFYERTPYYDQEYRVYPVGRVMSR